MKPMLAAPCDDVSKLKFPLLATPKIDGIRCLVIDDKATSRSLKPIPNAFIRDMIMDADLNHFDGELTVGTTFNASTSGIMTEDGQPDFLFWVFDNFKYPDLEYGVRVEMLRDLNRRVAGTHKFIRVLMPVVIKDQEELSAYLEKCIADGFEGAMVRSFGGKYKFGRATFKEGSLIKIKPFEDDEATIIGVEEMMQNNNEATVDALGHTERSSHKANLSPKGTMGKIVVNHPTYGEFRIGTGFDTSMRNYIWKNRDSLVGRLVKFKYQKIGTVDKPRIPSFLGFRNSEDLS